MKFSHFDISEFGDLSDKETVISLARNAEASERYEDMCLFMKARVTECGVKDGNSLGPEERNLLSVAYKNVIGLRRASWRALTGELETGGPQVQIFLDIVLEELVAISEDIIKLLEDHLIDSNSDTETNVFYLKMAGDYYRYLTESNKSNEDYKNKCKEYYNRASVMAKELTATHPIVLGLYLNFSVCWYEILDDKQKACELAKNAFDAAISELEKLSEGDYKDATLIMQLLRDNLTLWTQNEQEAHDNITVENVDDDAC